METYILNIIETYLNSSNTALRNDLIDVEAKDHLENYYKKIGEKRTLLNAPLSATELLMLFGIIK